MNNFSRHIWSGGMAEADEENRRQWLALSPQDRMEALEFIRAASYGYTEEDQPRPEFQKVYQIAELGGTEPNQD